MGRRTGSAVVRANTDRGELSVAALVLLHDQGSCPASPKGELERVLPLLRVEGEEVLVLELLGGAASVTI
jgi:hypothetical protein